MRPSAQTRNDPRIGARRVPFGIQLNQPALALAAGVIVLNERLTAWNVAARALISVGYVLATRRHEEARVRSSLPHQSLRSLRSPHPSAR
jgi:drug/metabolite transporter (DMT)-like permease